MTTAYRTHHATGYLDDQIAFWLVAYVHKLDTHATWSAKWHSRRDDGGPETSDWLFRNYNCSAEVLHAFIQRGLVIRSEKAVTEHIFDSAWEKLQSVEREPDPPIWFEIVIDTFTDDAVTFSLSLWGYKYHLANLSLQKQHYYLFADRLQARVRFVHEWFALEAAVTRLKRATRRGKVLPAIGSSLSHELSLLRAPTDAQVAASCGSLALLLERAIREYVESASGRRAGNFDDLIRSIDHELAPDTTELLRFIAKPMRNFLAHGRALPLSLAKLVLAAQLEVLARLGDVGA